MLVLTQHQAELGKDASSEGWSSFIPGSGSDFSFSYLLCSSPGFCSIGTVAVLGYVILCGSRGAVLCIVGCLAAHLASTH